MKKKNKMDKNDMMNKMKEGMGGVGEKLRMRLFGVGVTSVTASQAAWTILIVIIVAVAIIAIVFAILAFGESQVTKPYRNIVRHDIIAKGDLVAEGDSKMDAVDAESLQVHKVSSLNRVKISSLRFQDVTSITQTGFNTIQLSCDNTSYRVDSPGTNIIDFVLPPASAAPGQIFQIMKSQLGLDNTVNVTVATGDYLCDSSGCQPSSSLPIITLLPNQADQLWISNDFTNSWKPI
jgi:hypothetical protein